MQIRIYQPPLSFSLTHYHHFPATLTHTVWVAYKQAQIMKGGIYLVNGILLILCPMVSWLWLGFNFSFLLLSSVLHMSGSMTLKSVCIMSWPGVTLTEHTKQILHKDSLTLNDDLNFQRVAIEKGCCLQIDNITKLKCVFIMLSLHCKLHFFNLNVTLCNIQWKLNRMSF